MVRARRPALREFRKVQSISMSPYSAKCMIRNTLNGMWNHSGVDKIRFVIWCMNDTDWAVEQEVYKVIKGEFPQYRKVLECPEKYKVLL